MILKEILIKIKEKNTNDFIDFCKITNYFAIDLAKKARKIPNQPKMPY